MKHEGIKYIQVDEEKTAVVRLLSWKKRTLKTLRISFDAEKMWKLTWSPGTILTLFWLNNNRRRRMEFFGTWTVFSSLLNCWQKNSCKMFHRNDSVIIFVQFKRFVQQTENTFFYNQNSIHIWSNSFVNSCLVSLKNEISIIEN